MRKVIASEYVTLDGVMEAPNEWSLQFWSDEAAKYKFDELFSSGALLLGRITYEGFAAAWPSMKDEEGFADRMNDLPKYVVSSSLEEVGWRNSRLIKGDIPGEITKLKQQSGQDILIGGSAELVQTLMRHDLIDEYRLMVHPVVVGRGKRLFKESNKRLKLVETKPLSSGVIILHYQPDQRN